MTLSLQGLTVLKGNKKHTLVKSEAFSLSWCLGLYTYLGCSTKMMPIPVKQASILWAERKGLLVWVSRRADGKSSLVRWLLKSYLAFSKGDLRVVPLDGVLTDIDVLLGMMERTNDNGLVSISASIGVKGRTESVNNVIHSILTLLSSYCCVCVWKTQHRPQ